MKTCLPVTTFLFVLSMFHFDLEAEDLLAPSQSSPARVPRLLSYEEAAKLALTENPDLTALRHQEDAFKSRAKLAFAPSNPVFAVTKNDLSGLSPASESVSTTLSATFTLGFPGKAYFQSSATRLQAKVFSEQALAKEIDLLVALSNTYAALTVNRNFFEFLQDEEKKVKGLEKLVEKKFAAGQAARVDLLNARVAVANQSQSLISNRNEHEQLVTTFLNLIKRPGTSEFLPAVSSDIRIPALKISLEEMQKLMTRNRHLLHSSKAQVDASEAILNAAWLGPLPDFQLTGAINDYHVPASAPIPGQGRDYSLGIGMAIPLFFPMSELEAIRAAREDRQAVLAQFDSQKLQALADLQTIYTNFRSAEREYSSLESLVAPAAKESYDLMLLTYSVGKADFFRLNDSRQTWFQAEKDLLSKKLSLAQLYNQIVQQVGCDIEKKEGPHACV